MSTEEPTIPAALVQLFSYNNSKHIRFYRADDGRVWCVANDVLALLQRTRTALRHVDPDFLLTANFAGESRNMTVVSEEGIYQLLARASTRNNPVMRHIQKWMFITLAAVNRGDNQEVMTFRQWNARHVLRQLQANPPEPLPLYEGDDPPQPSARHPTTTYVPYNDLVIYNRSSDNALHSAHQRIAQLVDQLEHEKMRQKDKDARIAWLESELQRRKNRIYRSTPPEDGGPTDIL